MIKLIEAFLNLLIKAFPSLRHSLFSSPLEKKFKKTIEEIKNKKKLDKIVIAIDNLDKCPKEQSLEILQTVKTLLDVKNTIFIIAINDQEIGDSQDGANKFLQEIFDRKIMVEGFSQSKLKDFTMKLIEEYELDIPEKEEVASIISQGLKTPGEIKRFLNKFQEELYLIIKWRKEYGIPEDVILIPQHILFFTRWLIIREFHPNDYEMLNEKWLIKDIDWYIKQNEFNKEGRKWKLEKLNITLDEDVYRFLERTSYIASPEGIIPMLFFTNKNIFKDIPYKYYHYINFKNFDTIIEDLKKENIDCEKFLRFLNDIVYEEVIKGSNFIMGYKILLLIVLLEIRKFCEPHKISHYENIMQLQNNPNIREVLKRMIEYYINQEIIPKISRNPDENETKEKVEIVKSLSIKLEGLSFDTTCRFIAKCASLLGILESYQNWEIFKFWLETLTWFINGFNPSYTNNPSYTKYMEEEAFNPPYGFQKAKRNLFHAIASNYDYIYQQYCNGLFEKTHIEVYQRYTTLISLVYMHCSNERSKKKLIDWFDSFLDGKNEEIHKHIIEEYNYLVENSDYYHLIIPKILDRFSKEDKPEEKKRFAEILMKMVYKPISAEILIKMVRESIGNRKLSEEDMKKIVYSFFKERFERNNPDATDWLIALIKNNEAKEIIEDYIKNNIDKNNLLDITELIALISADAYFDKIKELLTSPDPQEQQKGIEILYQIEQRAISFKPKRMPFLSHVYAKDKIEWLKSYSISSSPKGRDNFHEDQLKEIALLLSKLNIDNFDEETKRKIEEIKLYF